MLRFEYNITQNINHPSCFHLRNYQASCYGGQDVLLSSNFDEGSPAEPGYLSADPGSRFSYTIIHVILSVPVTSDIVISPLAMP